MSPRAKLEVILDCSDPESLKEFWREALGYRVHHSEPSLAVLVSPEGNACPLLLQRVPEPKTGKNRMHLDIVATDIEAEAHRMATLGARRLHEGVRSFGRVSWVTMADPEDNEFCISSGVEW